jgi:hypothetical protein
MPDPPPVITSTSSDTLPPHLTHSLAIQADIFSTLPVTRLPIPLMAKQGMRKRFSPSLATEYPIVMRERIDSDPHAYGEAPLPGWGVSRCPMFISCSFQPSGR